jgi:hypothetical protein
VRLNETCKGDEWIIVNLQQAGKFWPINAHLCIYYLLSYN